MASRSSRIRYYEQYYDSDHAMATYYVDGYGFAEYVYWQISNLVKFFSSGAVKGDTLIHFGESNYAAVLFPACGYFKDIILIDYLDTKLQSTRKWINKEPGAFDWSKASKLVCKLEGNRENWIEKEETVRGKIKQIIKCEANEDGPVVPSLPTQADCLLLMYMLELLCSDLDAFCKALKDMSSLLKIGGYLLINILLGCTFKMSGKFKFPVLCLEKEFVKQAVIDAGFAIKESKDIPRVHETESSIIDCSGILFLVAYKERSMYCE